MRYDEPKGPIRILCDEIGYPWDQRIERPDVLVAFVRSLVAEIAEHRDMAARIGHLTGKPPSEGSLTVLALAEGMLSVEGASALTGGAILVHEACDRLNPDDAYPTDHIIDMLSACASAIRFGLKTPCHSRHAADAAQEVWKQLYGVNRFDNHTPAWSKDWARSCLQNAILSLLPAESPSPQSEAKPRAGNPATDDLNTSSSNPTDARFSETAKAAEMKSEGGAS
jgi:hypothetical protein